MERKVERLNVNEDWEEIPMEDLKLGDVFIMWNFIDYKNKWELYEDSYGKVVWKVLCNPYTHPTYGVWTIHVKNAGGTPKIVLWDMDHLIYGDIKFYYGMLAL